MDIDLRKKYFSELDKENSRLISHETGLLDDKYSIIINCPICKSSHEERVLFVKKGYTFVRCNKCEMIYTNPQVKVNIVENLYKQSKANDLWVQIQESAIEQVWKNAYYKKDIIDIVNKFRNKWQHELIDVGCNSGNFLTILSDYSSELKGTGVEISKKSFKYAIDKGLNVHNCPLSELTDNKFDIFILNGVLEHLTDPCEIFNDIKAKSNPGSLFFAIVPNAYSLYHMMLQEKSVSFDGKNHLMYFSKKTLKDICELNGFEVLKLDTVLTGADAIKQQMQWMDPYGDQTEDKYLNEHLVSTLLNDEFIYNNDLGLRLRVVARLI